MYIKGERCKTTFIKYLNGKKIADLLPTIKKFVEEVFPESSADDLVECHYVNNGKVDIELIVNNQKKRIMIKAGDNSLIHCEEIDKLMAFLLSVNVPFWIVQMLEKYLSTDTENELYQNVDVNLINDYLKKDFVLLPLLDRILTFDYYNKKIDYLYYGNVLNGRWITMEELKKVLINNKNNHTYKTVRIANLALYKIYSKNQSNSYERKCGFKVGNLYTFINKKSKSNP